LNNLTRRRFMRMAAASSGAIVLQQALSACMRNNEDFSVSQIPSPDGNISKPAGSNIKETTETSTPPSNDPYLVVARGGEPEEMVRRSIAALGGMERFVPKGSNVVLKPNICVAYHSFEYAATTNPLVVGTLVKLAFEAGARQVQVMDFPFGGSPQQAYAISGIEEQVKAAGGEMVVMKEMQYVDKEIPGAKNLVSTSINDLIYSADVLINVPIAKDHSLAQLTLGMKNLMGAIKDRGRLHENINVCLADLNTLLKPTLTVIDAVRILMANGPTGGDLNDVKQTNTIIASQDIVAADSYAAGLFGMKPEDLGYLVEGSSRGLGRIDLENLKIEEIVIDG